MCVWQFDALVTASCTHATCVHVCYVVVCMWWIVSNCVNVHSRLMYIAVAFCVGDWLAASGKTFDSQYL